MRSYIESIRFKRGFGEHWSVRRRLSGWWASWPWHESSGLLCSVSSRRCIWHRCRQETRRQFGRVAWTTCYGPGNRKFRRCLRETAVNLCFTICLPWPPFAKNRASAKTCECPSPTTWPSRWAEFLVRTSETRRPCDAAWCTSDCPEERSPVRDAGRR